MTINVRTDLLLGAALVAGLALCGPATAGELRVEAGEQGELALNARGVQVVEVLQAMSSECGFDVVMHGDGARRPPVNVEVPMAPVDDVLRDLLHDRNYAIVYAEDGAPAKVIVLKPSDPRRASRPARKPPPKRAKAQRGPTVIRR